MRAYRLKTMARQAVSGWVQEAVSCFKPLEIVGLSE
jgi:hypothetical protein